jgi:O-antigen/teichoic acid export membrane protein
MELMNFSSMVSLHSILTFIKLKILSGDDRTVLVKKNILGSFLIKGLNILIMFVMVPLLLNYLDPIKYGIWLTLASIVQWFSFFDIGLSNGLRNKFAEAKALGDKERARIYISTTYFFLTIISLIIITLLSPLVYFLDWAQILNAPNYLNKELKTVFVVTLSLFMAKLVLQTIGAVLLGDQRSASNDLLNPLSNTISMLFILFLTFFYKGSFTLATISLSISPLIVYTIASIYLYNTRYKEYKPKLKFVKLEYFKVLFNLGTFFFIIQASGIILYSTTNFIITKLFGPSEVTNYNIVYRYFNSVLMIFSIIVTPFWSAFTDAYTLKDFIWIKNIIKKLRISGLICIGIIIVMIFFSDLFYKFWIGETIRINLSLTLLLGIYFTITIFNMHFCYFLNGINRIKEQAIMALIGAVIHIPISLVINSTFKLGAESIVLSLIIISLPSLFIYPYLYNKEIQKNI